jgi:ubiquinone/menaquinone biosynthesis C-methylase UbiE
MSNTDYDWELIGQRWPYYGVYSLERFRHGSRQEFFESGEIVIHGLAEKLRTLYGSFSPRRALDFGCGVGRLTIPLAKRSQSVVGADVSVSMLREAENNCRQFGVTNSNFIKSDDSMSLEGEFDFIHSFIVFQHIPTKRGYAIFDGMLRLLSKGGIGAVHFTLKDERPLSRKMVTWLRRHVFRFDWLANTLRGRPASEPAMQMNDYNACTLLSMLEKHGCREINLEPISWSGRFAGVLFFRKSTCL